MKNSTKTKKLIVQTENWLGVKITERNGVNLN